MEALACLPVFLLAGHSAGVGGSGHRGDGCAYGPQVLNDRGQELLAGALIQVKADLIGHQEVVIFDKLLQYIAHSLRVIEENQTLR